MTTNSTDLLFQMLDSPESYSEEQWQEILADDECFELYTLLSKTQSAALAHRLTQRRRSHSSHSALQKAAAVLGGIVLLSGLAVAAVLTIRHATNTSLPEQTERPSMVNGQWSMTDSLPTDSAGRHQPVLYDNVTLEQMMDEMSRYYHVEVQYESDEVRGLRLFFQWEPDSSLEHVVTSLSHLESFRLCLENGLLIVQSSKKGSHEKDTSRSRSLHDPGGDSGTDRYSSLQ